MGRSSPRRVLQHRLEIGIAPAGCNDALGAIVHTDCQSARVCTTAMRTLRAWPSIHIYRQLFSLDALICGQAGKRELGARTAMRPQSGVRKAIRSIPTAIGDKDSAVWNAKE